MVKVAAFDLYNEGTAVYNGPYQITLTDITGVNQMVDTFTGGLTVTSVDILVAGDGDSVDLGSKFTHRLPFRRLHCSTASRSCSTISPTGDANQASRAPPGYQRQSRHTEECDLTVPDRIAESTVVLERIRRPTPSSPPSAPSVTLTANTTYWIVFPDMNHVDYAIGVSAGAEAREYDGSGWTLDGYAPPVYRPRCQESTGQAGVWSVLARKPPTSHGWYKEGGRRSSGRIGLWAGRAGELGVGIASTLAFSRSGPVEERNHPDQTAALAGNHGPFADPGVRGPCAGGNHGHLVRPRSGRRPAGGAAAGRAGPELRSRRLPADPTKNAKESVS